MTTKNTVKSRSRVNASSSCHIDCQRCCSYLNRHFLTTKTVNRWRHKRATIIFTSSPLTFSNCLFTSAPFKREYLQRIHTKHPKPNPQPRNHCEQHIRNNEQKRVSVLPGIARLLCIVGVSITHSVLLPIHVLISLSSRTPARLPPKTPSRSRPTSDRVVERDAVQVFCRLRPMQSDADLSCFRVASPSTVALTPPESAINFKSSALKETQYGFKHVFDAASTQRACYQVVAQPLVENLLRGKNGLLFTYGVTGSGKTYTMTGNAQDQGIMPRCLDVLFKTIADYQTKKYVFKPDRLNGFEILCEADAMLERQADMLARFTRQTGAAAAAATGAQTPHRKYSDGSEVASRASCDASTVDGLDEDNMFAVFISYVEVYNNSVYDLLEEGGAQLSLQQQQRAANAGTGTGTLQSKIIREDSSKTMYVHGVQEVEVKTVQEAIETFQRGQKRKRVGHTLLNAESSRSHSVFTIRLVQAPTDGQGESVMMDRRTVTVSQLSLVDLAGSERTNRTKNTGARLREAGNINNSLMSLRTCLEVLRENQTAGMMVRKVPYRDAKITHLFKSYFDGEGVVRMVVCINPRAEDYDESVVSVKRRWR